ncbi:MAG: hypothetical protein KDC56_09895, partial [Flavobacteriaceae bacterium]|nr:hypothetical protein [Flavobacteriaceae bacterium]
MMNKGILLWILLLQTLAIQSQDFAGTWYGKLAINGAQMRLVFHIHPDTEPASGTMDSPDQGAYDIALESVLIKGDSLLLASHAIGFSYKGVQGSEGIVGRFVQNGYNVPLFLQREYIEASRAQRPQTPVEPFPYSIT